MSLHPWMMATLAAVRPSRVKPPLCADSVPKLPRRPRLGTLPQPGPDALPRTLARVSLSWEPWRGRFKRSEG